jgi:nicotinate-nucleotide pyrophosphorylase (carboxylating)
MKPAPDRVRVDVMRALEEDLGAVDLTAQLLPAWGDGSARIITREDAILCGTDWAEAAFRALDTEARIEWSSSDGDSVQAGQTLCLIKARVRAIVSAERTALNFLQTLSGTATTARKYADAVKGTRTRILDTRKTLPGLRAAQKYAVCCGGAVNHRAGLYDAVLIKENHIRAAGSIAAAIAAARAVAGSRMVEIEVENLTEFETALAAKPDRIMLDELSVGDMRRAVALNAGQAELEISGGVSIERLPELAAIGVDYISVGALTKHVRAIDLSLRME